VKRTLEWSKILFSERKGTRPTSRQAWCEGTTVFSRNPINWINQINEINEINQINHLNHPNVLNHLNELNQTNPRHSGDFQNISPLQAARDMIREISIRRRILSWRGH
jgi:hypothetical protein